MAPHDDLTPSTTNDTQSGTGSQGRISEGETDMNRQSTPLPAAPGLQRTSLEGKIEICAEEGIGIERYRDTVRVWTIGCGITAAAGADINPNTYTGSITVRHALDMMDAVLPDYEAIIHGLLGNQSVPQHVFDGLVCAAWNIGPKFGRGEMTNYYVRRGEYRKALIMWKKSGGKVSQALLARRHREADICERGHYHADMIGIYDGRGPRNTPRLIRRMTKQELIAMMNPKGIS